MSTNRGSCERGATAVIVAVVIAMLLGFGALAVDVGHLYLSRNELQNAADACALRGAGVLYYDLATADYVATPQTTANQEGRNAGIANQAENTAVEINWTSGNTGDVQRGHWNFDAHTGLAAKTFTPNDSTAAFSLWDKTTDELDWANGEGGREVFINAVHCVTRREATPVTNFLAPVLGIFGGTGFATSIVRAEAVAYIGFAGSLEPGAVDQPIAICADKIENDPCHPTSHCPEYTCSIGRMLNDGNTEGTSETAMWTDFNQSTNCSAASSNDIRPLICANGNPGELLLGNNIDSTNGVVTSAFDDFLSCWKTGLNLDTNGDDEGDALLDTDNPADGWPDQPWHMTLPVVKCDQGPCTPLSGAVTVNVVAVVRSANLIGANRYDEVPPKMAGTGDIEDWECSSRTTGGLRPIPDCADSLTFPEDGDKGQCCWNEFVGHFNLRNSDNAPAPYASKSIYFFPDCTPHEPVGHTGGTNYGIPARWPSLVK